MTGAIGKYLISVSATAILLSLVQTILPKGAISKVCSFVGGLLVVIAVLSPLAEIDYDGLARSFMRSANATINAELPAYNRQNELLTEIIKQNCETYIWDKANELGADLEVDVTLSDDEDYPCPISVVLTGKATTQQQYLLKEYIQSDMGIPIQRQEWQLH